MRWHRNTQTGVWTAADTLGGHYRAQRALDGHGWQLTRLTGAGIESLGYFAKVNGLSGAKFAAQFDLNRRRRR